MSDVVAVHCDVADRPADADPDDDLAWFATQEIDPVATGSWFRRVAAG